MPTRPARLCIEPACSRLVVDGSRCPKHATLRQRERERPRGTRQERGYGAEWQVTRLRILERDGYRCAYCGGPAGTVDHIVAKARGGTDYDSNLTAACVQCNSGKRERVYRAG